MLGKPHTDCAGQLATLDAIVFFSASILVSSTLLAYALPEGERGLDEIDIDPASMLEVLLRASVGEEIRLEVNGMALIRANDEIGECLMAEVHALGEGVDIAAFDALNGALARIMNSVCGPCISPHLSVLDKEDDSVVLALPDLASDSRNAFASSLELTDLDGSRYIVELVLLPAAPLEIA